MKKTRLLAVTAAALLVLNSLTACGGGGSSAGGSTTAAAQETKKEEAEKETTKEAEKETEKETEAAKETSAAESKAPETSAAETTAQETAAEIPVPGEYTLFAVTNEGMTVNSADMDMTSVITLDEGGTGSMTMDEDSMPVTHWEETDGKISITMEDGGAAEGTCSGGIIELDILGTGEMLMLFAKEGADTSGYEILSLDEVMEKMAAGEVGMSVQDTKVGALWQKLDTKAGVRMKYTRTLAELNAEQVYDVQGKDGVFYSSRTTLVSGVEDTSVTFFQDGKAYTLSPKDMTGTVATETSSSLIAQDVMMLDELYQAIRTKAESADCTEETREIDGISYAAEVFPATELEPEAVFCFTESGDLAYYIQGAPVSSAAAATGEAVYKIDSIDGNIDEALFDISGYKIQ